MPKVLNRQKKVNKSTPNGAPELFLVRMSIEAIRARVNAELDALACQVDGMLPAADGARYSRYKNFSKHDWGEFLDCASTRGKANGGH